MELARGVQHVLEVLIGVVPIHARRLNETHDSRCTLTRTQAASEQPVVAPNGNRPDLILDPVVIHGKLSVIDEARQRLPPAQAVIERLGCRRIARHLLSLQCHPLVQRIDDGSGSLLPDGFAFICSGILDLSLDVINLAKLRQRCLGNLAFASGMQIKELAPRVRQAARLGHAAGEQGFVARVIVAHERAAPSALTGVPEELGRVPAGAAFGEGDSFQVNFDNQTNFMTLPTFTTFIFHLINVEQINFKMDDLPVSISVMEFSEEVVR